MKSRYLALYLVMTMEAASSVNDSSINKSSVNSGSVNSGSGNKSSINKNSGSINKSNVNNSSVSNSSVNNSNANLSVEWYIVRLSNFFKGFFLERTLNLRLVRFCSRRAINMTASMF